MDLLDVVIVLFLVFVFIPFCRTATTYIHELGHGLAALLLTEGPVKIYIGTYGSEEGTLEYGIGRLQFYHRFSLLQSRGGVCYPGETDNLWNRIIISLMGPLASAIAGIIIVSIALAYDWSGNLQFFAFIFFASTIIDLIHNLWPSPDPIVLDDGSITYRDGTSIQMNLRWMALPVSVREVITKKQGSPFEQMNVLETAYEEPSSKDLIRAHLLNLYINSSAWERGLSFYTQNPDLPDPVNDYIALPVFESMSGDQEKALKTTERLLKQASENPLLLLNRSYILNLDGQYKAAQEQAEALLEDPIVGGAAHSNLAYALAHQGDTATAKEHAEHSITKEPTNAYAFMTLGIVNKLAGQTEEANEAFRKAHEINALAFGLDKFYTPGSVE